MGEVLSISQMSDEAELGQRFSLAQFIQ